MSVHHHHDDHDVCCDDGCARSVYSALAVLEVSETTSRIVINAFGTDARCHPLLRAGGTRDNVPRCLLMPEVADHDDDADATARFVTINFSSIFPRSAN